MVDFSKKDINLINQVLTVASEKTEDDSLKNHITKILPKVTSLGEYFLEIPITNQDLENLNTTMEALHLLVQEYTTAAFIDVENFDRVKRKMAGHLEMLSTLRDTFLTPAHFAEDVLKKQIRAEVMEKIKDEQKCSITQAKEFVEKDARYITQRDRLEQFKRVANSVKTKYDFYMKIWQGVIQNVSTASKENYTSKTSS